MRLSVQSVKNIPKFPKRFGEKSNITEFYETIFLNSKLRYIDRFIKFCLKLRDSSNYGYSENYRYI